MWLFFEAASLWLQIIQIGVRVFLNSRSDKYTLIA